MQYALRKLTFQKNSTPYAIQSYLLEKFKAIGFNKINFSEKSNAIRFKNINFQFNFAQL